MAIIETKYNIGDVVWLATTNVEQRIAPCPDCLGTKVWKATSPAGTDYEFPCPRCATNSSIQELSLKYCTYVPDVQKRTIGSVRHDTRHWVGQNENEQDQYQPITEYMCHETGIGSGSVYKECTLFPDEASALIEAEKLAQEANERSHKSDQQDKRYPDRLVVAAYQLREARMEACTKAMYHQRSRFEILLGDLECAESIEEVSGIIETFKSKD